MRNHGASSSRWSVNGAHKNVRRILGGAKDIIDSKEFLDQSFEKLIPNDNDPVLSPVQKIMKEHRIFSQEKERKLGESDIKITFGAIPDLDTIEQYLNAQNKQSEISFAKKPAPRHRNILKNSCQPAQDILKLALKEANDSKVTQKAHDIYEKAFNVYKNDIQAREHSLLRNKQRYKSNPRNALQQSQPLKRGYLPALMSKHNFKINAVNGGSFDQDPKQILKETTRDADIQANAYKPSLI